MQIDSSRIYYLRQQKMRKYHFYLCFHKHEEISFKRVKNDVEKPSTEMVGRWK